MSYRVHRRPKFSSSFSIESLEARALMSGDGLIGTYFNDVALKSAVVTRLDPTVNFSWGLGAPADGVNADKFSARWAGKVLARSTGPVSFYTASDDGVRLWVNGTLLIDNWARHATVTNHKSINLVSGKKYDIKMEYYDDSAAAVAKLWWSSATIARQIVPTNSLFSNLRLPLADTQPPSAPTNLLATAKTDQTVSLSWTAATDNVGISKYDIYRDGMKVGSTSATHYTDSGLIALTNYSYSLKAIDRSKNSSKNSAALSTITNSSDAIAPTVPGSLSINAKTDSSITLSWSAASDNVGVTEYDLYRQGVKVATFGANTFSTTNLNLQANANYAYFVIAVDGAGNTSPASNTVAQTTDASSPTGSGNGLLARYYDNTDFTSLKLTRTDAAVNFDWGGGSPDASVGSDTFAARWTGQIQAKYSEQYTFYATADDGVRLWVNNHLIIDHWTAHSAAEDSGKISLTQGQMYSITMEYFDNTNDATARLSWSSATTPKQIVPTSFLYAGESTTAPPIAGNWTNIFDDEFNSLNTTTWGERYWWNGDKGQEVTFKPNNVTVNNGVLTITAKKETATAFDGTVNQYTSGLLTTGGIKNGTPGGFSFTYGYMEARIKIPAGQGLWPSFWALPANYDDYQGELDAMEIVSARSNIHEMHYHRQGWDVGNTFDAGKSLGDDYHVYALDWEPDHISWVIDGVEKYRYTSKSSTDIVNQAMYLILNLDLGGPWAGSPNSTTPIPAQMNVDYVRVWQMQ